MKSILMERNGQTADVHPHEVSNFTAAGWLMTDDDDDETDAESLQLFIDYLGTQDEKPKISEVFDATGVKVSGKQITAAWRELEFARESTAGGVE